MATPTTAGRVIIGQGITVKGDIKNCEEVIVRGFFDAGNVEAKTVVVEADGKRKEVCWFGLIITCSTRSLARAPPRRVLHSVRFVWTCRSLVLEHHTSSSRYLYVPQRILSAAVVFCFVSLGSDAT